jgi:hypothetical protein
MSPSERVTSLCGSDLSVGPQAIRGEPDAAPREPQVPVPEKANFVVCDQTIYTVLRGGAQSGSALQGQPVRSR